MKKIIFISLILALFIMTFQLFAQVHGTIKGTVTDMNGNPIPGVTITLTSTSYTSLAITIKSNKKGEFVQMGLQPDYYQIKGEKDGYFPVIFEKRIRIQSFVDASFVMEKGQHTVAEGPGEKDFNEGNEWYTQGKFEEAAKSYQQAIDKEGDDPIYYNNLGISLMKLEKLDEAIDIYKKMLEIQPESYSANKNIGELFGAKKEYQKALPYFEMAVELSPDDPDAFYSLGACLLNTGAPSDALTKFMKTIAIKPDYSQAYYQMGMIYVNQNKKEEAIENLEKFLELSPNDPNAPVAQKIVEYLKSTGD